MIKYLKSLVSDFKGLIALRYLAKNMYKMDAGDYKRFNEILNDYKSDKDYKKASERSIALRNKMTSR